MPRPRILLVNGDKTVQHLRALMLRLKDYEVDLASSVDTARSKTDLFQYELVIVDVGHFAKPGLEFCEELKQKYPDQKVLMQVDYHLFLNRNTCPDKVISKEEGPQSFVSEVESLLAVS
jgi:DNA-binding NtrC family response regulator